MDTNEKSEMQDVYEETWFERNKKIIYGCGMVALAVVGGIVIYRNWSTIISCVRGMKKVPEKVVAKDLVNKVTRIEKVMAPDQIDQIKQTVVPICKTIIPDNFKLTGNQFTARDLGKKMYCSAQEINKRIINKGLAVRLPSGELSFTELGKGLGEMKWKTTWYEHNFINIEWDEAILPLLFSKEELERVAKITR